MQGQISKHIFKVMEAIAVLKIGEYSQIFLSSWLCDAFRPIVRKQKYLMDYNVT